MELYIIRHAQSTNNVLADQRERVADPNLTDIGREQAALLARHLASGPSLRPQWNRNGHSPNGFGLTRLYCSPMWRSLLTAQPVAETLNVAPEVWIDIHEHGGIYLDHGANQGIVGYGGKTRAEILAEFPGYRLPPAITEQGWWNQGFEEWSACYSRACQVADLFRSWAGQDERVAIISHGAFIEALLRALTGCPSDEGASYVHFNTGISRVDFVEDGRIAIWYLNRVDHLPPDLIT